MGAFNSNYPGGGKTFYYPYVQFVDAAGNALTVEQNYRKSYTDTAGKGKLLDWSYRPLDEVNNADNNSQNSDILFDLGGDVQILKDLKFGVSGRYELGDLASEQYYSPSTFFTRDLINRFTQVNGNNVTRILPLGGY